MGDRLLAAPFLVSIQMAELLITIGARNFVEFTLSFLVEVALSVVQRLFLYPLIKTVMTLWPRWKLLAIQAFGSKGLTRQEKQEQELRWKKVNEDIELISEGVEPLLDSLSIYSVDKTGGIMLPFMCLLLMLLYNESEMAVKYNINKFELLYYCLFALYMIPWMSLVDTFILSSQELLYGTYCGLLAFSMIVCCRRSLKSLTVFFFNIQVGESMTILLINDGDLQIVKVDGIYCPLWMRVLQSHSST